MLLPEGYLQKQPLSKTATMQTMLAMSPSNRLVVLYMWGNDSLETLVVPLNPNEVENSDRSWISFHLNNYERSLAHIIEQNLLNPIQIYEIAIAACVALHKIHASGQFLGTLCPENMIWDESSKEIRFLWKANSLWHDQCVNWHYCAPEQTGRIIATPDYRSDFYALGLVFHCLFLQKHPFGDIKTKIMLRVHLTRQIKLPASLPEHPRIQTSVLAVINALVEKLACNRYQSALAVQADLEQSYKLFVQNVQDNNFRPAKKLSSRVELLDYSSCFIREKYALADLLKTIANEHIGLVSIEANAVDGRVPFLRDFFTLLSRKSICYLQVYATPESSEVAYYVTGLLLKELVHFFKNGDASLFAHCCNYVVSLSEASQQILLSLCADFTHWGINNELEPGRQINDYAMLYTVVRNLIHFTNSLTRPMVIYNDSPQWIDIASLRLLAELQEDPLLSNIIFLRFVDSANHLHFPAASKMAKANFHLPRFAEKQLADLIVAQYNIPQAEANQLAALYMKKTEGSFDAINNLLSISFEQKLVRFDEKRLSWQINFEAINEIAPLVFVEQWQENRCSILSSQTRNMLQWAAVMGMYFDADVVQNILEIDQQAMQLLITEAANACIVEYFPHYHSLNSHSNQRLYRFSTHSLRQAFFPLDAVDHKHHSTAVVLHTIPLLSHPDGFLWAGLLLENKTLWAEFNQDQQYIILHFIHQLAKKLTFFTRYKDAERLNGYCFSLLKPASWLDRYYLSKEVYHLAMFLACSTNSFERVDSLYASINEPMTGDEEKYSFHLLKMNNAIGRKQFDLAQQIALSLFRKHDIEPTNNNSIWSKFVLGFKEKLFENKLFNNEISLATKPESLNDQILAQINLISCNYLEDIYFSSIDDIIKQVANNGIKNCFAMPLLYYSLFLITSGKDVEKGIKISQIIYEMIFTNADLQRQKTLFFIIYILPFVKKVTSSMKTIKASIREALMAGDHKSAHFLATHFIIHQFLSGSTIPIILKEIQEIKHLLPQISKSGDFYSFVTIAENRSRAINDVHYQFDETDTITTSGNRISYWNDLTLLLYFYYKSDFEKALISAENAHRKSAEIETQTNTYLLDFYHALTLLELFPSFSEHRKAETVELVTIILNRFKLYAQFCPENFDHKYWLLCGFLHQAKGEEQDAVGAYKRSIAQSELFYFRNICGLASYKLAKLQIKNGDADKAKRNILLAYNNFILFGAQNIAHSIKFEFFSMFEDIEMNIYNIE